jgi:excisionase family DNA binding protein
MNVKQDDRLLRVEEAAERLGLKQTTMRDWLWKRRIPFVRVGPRAIRIKESVIQSIIEMGTVPARGER